MTRRRFEIDGRAIRDTDDTRSVDREASAGVVGEREDGRGAVRIGARHRYADRRPVRRALQNTADQTLLEIVGGASVTPTVKVSALLSEPSCARTERVCAPPLVSKSMRLPFATVSAPVAELTTNPPPELSLVSVKLSSGDIQLPHDRPGKSTVPVSASFENDRIQDCVEVLREGAAAFMDAKLEIMNERIDARGSNVGIGEQIRLGIEGGQRIAPFLPAELKIMLERIDARRGDVRIVAR